MEEEKKNKRIHAIVIPYPLQGHVTPTIHLAIKLASKGITITFVNTEAIHHQLSHSIHNIFSNSPNIRYTTISDGLPLEFDRSLNHDQFMFSLLHVMSAHVEQLLVKMSHDDDDLPVSCIVADTFFVWPAPIAKKFKLLYISFWTEPAMVFTLYHHMHLLKENGHFASVDNRDDTIDYIPGVPTIEPTDLPSYLQETDISTVCHQINEGGFRGAKNADWVLCNTVQELEPSTIGALNQELPFYAIGPILPDEFKKSSTSLWSESDCTEWLDSKLPGSVLYVSFGSYAHLGTEELVEIAWGLFLSTCDFIWVLRPDIIVSGEELPLPNGFLEKVKGKGLVVPWSCQIAVLSHVSIGGFLTHCGWNSVLESIWCGVPMLGFPLLTDQFTNRKLVADEWKVGNSIGKRKPVGRDEVARKINELMIGECGEEFRRELVVVKRALHNAVMMDGSSTKNLERFVEKLTVRIHGKI